MRGHYFHLLWLTERDMLEKERRRLKIKPKNCHQSHSKNNDWIKEKNIVSVLEMGGRIDQSID